MKTSKIITIIVLILFLVGIILYTRANNAVAPGTPAETNASSTQVSAVPQTVASDAQKSLALALVNKATFRVPEEDGIVVTLKDGQSDFGVAPGSEDGGFAQVVPESINVNTQTNTITAVIDINTGGTGIFSYVFLFKQSGNSLTESSFYFLGDRIKIEKTAINYGTNKNEYGVEVHYLDRKSSGSYAEDPTVPKVLSIKVVSDKFVDASAVIK